MKIAIKDIQPGGIEVSGHIPVAAIGLTQDDPGYFIAPLDVQAKVNRVNNTVLAKTKVHGKYRSVCARCLAGIERDWNGNFLLDFSVDKQTEAVELDEDIRQEVLLNVPLRVLCKEDCKGICPGCGADLNNEECKCK
ncbi:MAG: DUF177 domain-containing protein [Candidatus Omnitrophica bacterium]|nr:DUF177 domain-containing protein [Candidatus Omnitrophota bacterium]